MQVAEALNVPANRVTARVKRLGGGFGGKESRFSMISLPVAVAAYKWVDAIAGFTEVWLWGVDCKDAGLSMRGWL